MFQHSMKSRPPSFVALDSLARPHERHRVDLVAQPDVRADRRVGVGDGLRVDVAAHEVTLRGAPLALTLREYDLLVHLLLHPRQAFSRAQLLNDVWGWQYADHSTVTVHVRRLRDKVEDDPHVPRRILTVFGIGYRYEPGAAP